MFHLLARNPITGKSFYQHLGVDYALDPPYTSATPVAPHEPAQATVEQGFVIQLYQFTTLTALVNHLRHRH